MRCAKRVRTIFLAAGWGAAIALLSPSTTPSQEIPALDEPVSVKQLSAELIARVDDVIVSGASGAERLQDIQGELAAVLKRHQQEELSDEREQAVLANLAEKMKTLLDVGDHMQRCKAALVLATLGDQQGVDAIIRELSDTSPRQTDQRTSNGKPYVKGQIDIDRRFAAILLGRLGDRQAVSALIEATKDESIADTAAISLGQIGDKSAIPALHQMMNKFSGDRLWAGYGLAALGEADGFDILYDVARNDSTWTQRRHAVDALGDMGDARSVPTLVGALKDQHVNVRVSAARALGKLGDPAALPALTAALQDLDVTEINGTTSVQVEAQKAIEAIEATESVRRALRK